MVDIGIIGAGAWGTALACAAARSGSNVLIWAREEEVVSAINDKHENSIFLNGITLPAKINATSNLNDMKECKTLLISVPAQYIRNLFESLKTVNLPKDIDFVICSKGIENNTNMLMSEVIESIIPGHDISIISGPTFATEVAKCEPTALSLACEDAARGNELIIRLSNPNFKLFYNDDIIGSQIGGSVKNVLAIGCGIAAGLGKGDNVNAAIISLGLIEMGRLSQAKGGKKNTNMELCCIGDLVLTCSSMQSRNMSLGYQIGQGKTLTEILETRQTVAEGVATSKSVFNMSEDMNIDMPICRQIYKILHLGEKPETIIDAIL